MGPFKPSIPGSLLRCGAVFTGFYPTATHRTIQVAPHRIAPYESQNQIRTAQHRTIRFSNTKIRTAPQRRILQIERPHRSSTLHREKTYITICGGLRPIAPCSAVVDHHAKWTPGVFPSKLEDIRICLLSCGGDSIEQYSTCLKSRKFCVVRWHLLQDGNNNNNNDT